jgi:hypothetical protein
MAGVARKQVIVEVVDDTKDGMSPDCGRGSDFLSVGKERRRTAELPGRNPVCTLRSRVPISSVKRAEDRKDLKLVPFDDPRRNVFESEI